MGGRRRGREIFRGPRGRGAGNVRRWRNGTMIRRWVGLGVLRAAARFRRIKGHGDLAALATALRPAAAGEQAA